MSLICRGWSFCNKGTDEMCDPDMDPNKTFLKEQSFRVVGLAQERQFIATLTRNYLCYTKRFIIFCLPDQFPNL